MKKYFIFFNIVFLFMTFNVKALTSSEIESRNVCNKIELAIANVDKTLTNIKCFDNYQEAKSEMNNTSNDDLVILERINNKTRIIDAK